MTLREKQSIFVKLVAKLIEYATSQGYELTFGEAWRSPEEAELLSHVGKGIKNSLHIKRLAIDLNLFKDGIYLSTTAAHKPLGDWWKKQSTNDYNCCWGGDFSTLSDSNHYSIEHEGIK